MSGKLVPEAIAPSDDPLRGGPTSAYLCYPMCPSRDGTLRPSTAGEKQYDGCRIEQQGNHQNEPPHGRLIGRAGELCQVAHRSKIGLDPLALADDCSLRDPYIGNTFASRMRAAVSAALLRCCSAKRRAVALRPRCTASSTAPSTCCEAARSDQGGRRGESSLQPCLRSGRY